MNAGKRSNLRALAFVAVVALALVAVAALAPHGFAPMGRSAPRAAAEMPNAWAHVLIGAALVFSLIAVTVLLTVIGGDKR
ncbi:MAG: hypothetical protein M3345_07160, partial [Actinomycetota bacterium]|nr:hypothetical protein [Actinomycetota bacterium]